MNSISRYRFHRRGCAHQKMIRQPITMNETRIPPNLKNNEPSIRISGTLRIRSLWCICRYLCNLYGFLFGICTGKLCLSVLFLLTLSSLLNQNTIHLIAKVLCYQTRSMPIEFSESKYVSFSLLFDTATSSDFFYSPPLSFATLCVSSLDHSVSVLSSAAIGAWCTNPCHRTGEYKFSIHSSLTHHLPHVIRYHSSHFHSKVSGLEILYLSLTKL